MSLHIDLLTSGRYDFIDFGCSNGGSLRYGMEVMGARRGVGVDLDARKVEAARASGLDTIHYDVTKIGEYRASVSFVLMFHFLEHLPGLRAATQSIRSGCEAARDFVLIRQPWFDSDGWLFSKGLKFYWSDWHGHTNPMRLLDFHRAIRDAAVPCRYRLYGRKRVISSEDAAIHPLGAPRDEHKFDAGRHGEKGTILFDVPAFYEAGCVILRSERIRFEDVEKHLGTGSEILFEGMAP